jgi:hypothetical protein
MSNQAPPPKRSLQELLEVREPAWPQVESWIKAASNVVEVLPPDLKRRDQALVDTQVTTRSPMGAIVYHSGGLLIDHGWLRFLGSGHSKLPRSMPAWNQGCATTSEGKAPGFWLVADDVVGGFFALDGGALGSGRGQVFYFAPDSLRWEPMNGMSYTDFLRWSLGGDVARFYQSMRWSGWESEVPSLRGDQAFSFYPPLCAAEGKDIAKCSREACPIAEIFSFNLFELPKQLQSHSE